MREITLYEMCHTDNPLRPVSGGVAPTLQARLGTGGNNVPVLVENPWDVQSKHIHNTDGISSSMCAAEKRWGGMAPIIDDGCLTPWDVQSRRIQSENGKAATLYGGAGQGTHNGAVLQTCYSFDSLASNSMKSKNPNSGCREVQVSKCIDTTNPDPSKNQGGIAIVDEYCIAGNTIDRKLENGGNGAGFQKDVSYTLNTIDRHAVTDVYPNKAGALNASDGKGKNGQDVNKFPVQQARIRRLTPQECERLQGLPDGWTDVDGATDSKRYKAIGNGMAQPCADYVIRQITKALANEGVEYGEISKESGQAQSTEGENVSRGESNKESY